MSEGRRTSRSSGDTATRGSIKSVSGSIRSSEATNLLKSISEASHETSSSATSNPHALIENNPIVNAPAQESSSWWPWGSTSQSGPETASSDPSSSPQLVQVSSIQHSVSSHTEDTNGTSWANYFSSYKDTVVGYVYYRDGNASETTPLLEGNSAASAPPEAANSQSDWFSWIWPGNKPQIDEEPYHEYTNDVEVYKSAKAAIENGKDRINYVLKGGISSQFLSGDNELAVWGTTSEALPVKYNIRKTPITQAEIQENTLQMVISNVNSAPNRAPTSSNSSIKSNAETVGANKFKSSYVVPDIKQNFRTITWITSLRLLGEKLLFQHHTSESHLYSLTDSNIEDKKLHRIKKVVIISVHSFLPSKFVKSMIGTTTGSAIQFTEEATKAVETWLNSNKESEYENMYSIETLSLEGQGPANDRVTKSIKLLENWKELINDCDFLYVVGHSHGSVVAIHLLSEIINSNIFKVSGKKLGLLSMAGPLNGPIKNMDTKIVVRAYTSQEISVINELIQLQNPQSAESVKLHQCLNELVGTHNVKLTLCGSIDDQLVPLDSALANTVYHPNIYRCVYVDKECTLPPFIVSLWKLVVISRNIGHLEHGVVKDIADKCMGPVTDGGHNKLYQDSQIYHTSIKFALETTDLKVSRDLKVIESDYDTTLSVYKLPWTLRELVQDILQTKHITSYELVQELVNNYRNWDGISKQWKDIKLSVEALAHTDFDDLIV